MTIRHFGLSSRTADGEVQPTGPHVHDAIHTRTNIIQFPRANSSLAAAANSERRSAVAPLSISDDACALCAFAVFITSFVIAIGLLIFAGYKVFGLIG